MKPRIVFAAVALIVLFLAACAPGANEQLHTTNVQGLTAGFWRGLWHGIIAPITFLISLFSANVGIYEAHNNGGWYDFGFLVGIFSFHGGRGAGGAARRWRGRRNDSKAGQVAG